MFTLFTQNQLGDWTPQGNFAVLDRAFSKVQANTNDAIIRDPVKAYVIKGGVQVAANFPRTYKRADGSMKQVPATHRPHFIG